MKKFNFALILVFTLPLSARAAVSTVHKDFKAGAGTALSVKSVSGNIAISAGTDDAVSADITYDSKYCEVIAEMRGKTVYFEAKQNTIRRMFSFGSKQEPCAKFVIKTPAGMDVAPVTVSGDISVERLNGPVTAQTVSGDAAITNPVALSFTTTSGNLTFSDAAGKMRFNSVSGDVSGTIRSSEDLEAHSVSGGIALKFLTAPQKGAFSLDSISGDLELTFPKGTKASASFHSVSGDQKNNIINDPDAAFKIAANTTSGDLTINSK